MSYPFSVERVCFNEYYLSMQGLSYFIQTATAHLKWHPLIRDISKPRPTKAAIIFFLFFILF